MSLQYACIHNTEYNRPAVIGVLWEHATIPFIWTSDRFQKQQQPKRTKTVLYKDVVLDFRVVFNHHNHFWKWTRYLLDSQRSAPSHYTKLVCALTSNRGSSCWSYFFPSALRSQRRQFREPSSQPKNLLLGVSHLPLFLGYKSFCHDPRSLRSDSASTKIPPISDYEGGGHSTDCGMDSTSFCVQLALRFRSWKPILVSLSSVTVPVSTRDRICRRNWTNIPDYAKDFKEDIEDLRATRF